MLDLEPHPLTLSEDLPSFEYSDIQYEPLLSGLTQVGARVFLSDIRQLKRGSEWRKADIICINYPELKKYNQKNKNIRELIRPSQDLFVTLTADSEIVDQESILSLGQTIAEVAPVTLIPDFAYVHGGDPKYLIDYHVDAYLKYLEKLVEIIYRLNEPISVVPLVKAISDEHYEKTKSVFRKLGFTTGAFYTSQFFGSESGNPINSIKSHIRRSITELNIEGAMIIGLGAPQRLRNLAPRVHVACYFRQWFDNRACEEQFEVPRRALRSKSDRQTRITNPAAWRTGEGN